MDDTTSNAYDHDGKQDAIAEDLKVVEMSDIPEMDSMNMLTEQLDELSEVKEKEKEESVLED
jgi:hypothetical protein